MRKSDFVWVNRLKCDERNHLVLFVVGHSNHSDMQAVFQVNKSHGKRRELDEKARTFFDQRKTKLADVNYQLNVCAIQNGGSKLGSTTDIYSSKESIFISTFPCLSAPNERSKQQCDTTCGIAGTSLHVRVGETHPLI